MAFQRKTKSSKSNEKKSNQQEVIPPEEKKKPFRFEKGNKMGGRPKGSRNKFTEQFYKDFLADWEVAGASAIQRCRLEEPATYCRIAASLVTKDFDPTNESYVLEKFLEQFTTVEEIRAFRQSLANLSARQESGAQGTKTLTGKQPN